MYILGEAEASMKGVDRKPSFICNSLLNLVFSGVMLARKKYLIFPPLFL